MSIIYERRFYYLLLGAVLGTLCVLPYASQQVGISFSLFMLVAAVIQTVIIYGVIIAVGLNLADRTGLNVVPSQPYVVVSVVAGSGVGLVLKLLDVWLFKHLAAVLSVKHLESDLIHRLLASVYGAVNEEIFMRLFAVSLIAWIVQKFASFNRVHVTSFAIILCAILFGLGHLPMLYSIVEPNTYDIVRVMALNGLAGCVFGVLYVRYGLLAAMLSHFITDIVLQGVLG